MKSHIIWSLVAFVASSVLSSRQIDRRLMLSASAAALSVRAPCFGRQATASQLPDDVAGVQWKLSLPDYFHVSRRLASIVRVKTETMLAAEDSSGIRVRLLLVPFGKQAIGSFSADEQLAIATFFLGESSNQDRASVPDIGAIMAASAARSPSVLKLQASSPGSLACTLHLPMPSFHVHPTDSPPRSDMCFEPSRLARGASATACRW